MKTDETIKKLQEAVRNGNAHIITGDEVLMSDGDCELLISANENMGEGIYCFTMRDGGGFTGLIFSEGCWESMKQKVDNVIAQRKLKK